MTLPLSADPTRPASRAFTLVELLVAISVTVVLVGLLSNMIIGAGNIATLTHSKLRASVDGSIALRMLISDLENIAWQGATGKLLETESANVGSSKSHRILMVSKPMDSPATGATAGERDGQVRGIAYRVGYQNPILGGGTDPTYALYRQTASAKTTFDEIMEVSKLQSHFKPTTPPPVVDFLIGDAVSLSITFWIENSGVLTRLPTADALVADARGYGVYDSDGSIDYSEGNLVRADVSLTVLSERGVRQLEAGVDFERVLATESHTFAGTAMLR